MTEDTAELLWVSMVFAGLMLLARRPVGDKLRAHLSWRRRDVELYALVVLTVATMVLVPVIDALVPWFEFADFPFLDEIAVLGIGVAGAAMWLFLWAQADLRRHGRPSASADPALVEHGIYRFVRHPCYAAMFLWALAQVMMLQNWLAGPAAALTFVVVYMLRAPLEDQALLERFGHRYLDYMARTGSLVPRWSRFFRD